MNAKDMAALIVAKPKDDAPRSGKSQAKEAFMDVESEGSDDGEYEMGLDVAAEDALAAFQANDPVALKDALKSFVEMCK